VHSLKKVKHPGERAHPAATTGIGLVLVACIAFAGALAMHLVGKPLGWSILAVVGGMGTLGVAGLSFIADIAETRAKRMQHKEEH
jgi:fucose permease